MKKFGKGYLGSEVRKSTNQISLDRKNSNKDFDTSFVNVVSKLMDLFALEDMTLSYAAARRLDFYLINIRSLLTHFKHLSLQNNTYALLYLHIDERTINSISFLSNSQLFPLFFSRVSQKCEKVCKRICRL